MRAVRTQGKFTLVETLSTIGWRAPREIPENRKDAIRAALQEDKHYVAQAADPYFFGVEVGKMTRIAEIALELNDMAAYNQMIDQIIQVLEPWLTNKNADYLVYDVTYGGIITKDGLSDF